MRVDRAELLGGEIPLRPLGVAELLDTALVALRRCPRALLGPAVVVVALVQAGLTIADYTLIGERAAGENVPEAVLRSLGGQLVLSAVGFTVTGFAILLLAGYSGPVLARSFFGLRVTPGAAWRDVRPRAGALLAVASGVMGGALLAGTVCLLPFVLAVGLDSPPALGVISGLLGFPIAAVVVVWLYVLGVLAAPAVVVERLSVERAFSRARSLVRGRWWRTAAVLTLTLIITGFMGFVALRVPFIVAELVLFGAHPVGWEQVGALSVNTLGRIVSWTITAPFDAAVIALVYLDRRMRREGLDLELQTLRETPDDFLALWADRAGAAR